MPAGEKHVGRAQEGGGDEAEGDELVLPEGRLAQDEADEEQLADHRHRGHDQPDRDVAGQPRERLDDGGEALHRMNGRAAYWTASASSISFWPSGTCLAKVL